MNRLIQLIQANSKQPRSFKVENATGEEATIFIYDVIGYDYWSDGGITALDFANEIAGITAKTVHLRINSPGGDVFEARAMVAAMQRHPANFIAHVDGVAASAAATLAVCADECEMVQGSMMMIHNAWTLVMGDRNDCSAAADLLGKMDGMIAADFAKRTGIDPDAVAAMMDEETWFTADEAVAQKFADRVSEGKAKNQTKWNLSAYAHAPAEPKEEPKAVIEPEPDPKPGQLHAARERELRLLDRTAA